MKHKIYSFFLVLSATFLLASQSQAQGERFVTNTPMSSKTTGYYEYLPQDYDAGAEKKYPLFLFFHGTGAEGDGSYTALQKLHSNLWGGPIARLHDQDYYGDFPTSFTVGGETFEYIFISPQFQNDPYWGNFSWITEIDDLITFCINNYNIDTNRIYLTGQSMGAGYALSYLSTAEAQAKRIAAVALASPNMKIGENHRNYGLMRGSVVTASRVGMWLTAADQDKSSFDAELWVNETADSIMNADPAPGTDYIPKVTIVPGTNHGTAANILFNPAQKSDGLNVYEWLLHYTRLSALPVTGLEITSRLSGNAVLVQWSTQSETGNSTFVVERRGPSGAFEAIHTIPAKNALQGAQYSFTDRNPLAGVNYYRVRQADLDGNFTYSKIVSVRYSTSALVTVYPNPVTDRFSVEVSGSGKIRSVKIFDQAGKLVREITGSNKIREDVQLSALPNGTYFGKVVTENGTHNFSFIKN